MRRALLAGLAATVLAGCAATKPELDTTLDFEPVLDTVMENGKPFGYTDFVDGADTLSQGVLHRFRRTFNSAPDYRSDLLLAELQAGSAQPDTLNGTRWIYFDREHDALIGYSRGGVVSSLEVFLPIGKNAVALVGEVEFLSGGELQERRIDGVPEGSLVLFGVGPRAIFMNYDAILSRMVPFSKIPEPVRARIEQEYHRLIDSYSNPDN